MRTGRVSNIYWWGAKYVQGCLVCTGEEPSTYWWGMYQAGHLVHTGALSMNWWGARKVLVGHQVHTYGTVRVIVHRTVG